MKVSSFKSKTKRGLHVLIRATGTLDSLPEDVKKSVGPLEYWKEFDIDSADRRIALHSAKAIQDIETRGFHLSQTDIRMTEN
jgi:uncharacterized protein YcgL (UPF0745 family)